MYQSVIKNIIPGGFIWTFLILVVVVILIAIFFLKERRDNLSNYIKRQFLFDTKSEFELFKLLVELFGDKYYVFPQVHYNHIIEARKGLEFSERMHYWNKINRKSADFVLCEKVQVTAQLVIELDGSSHEWEKRKERDVFINELMSVIGLKILHLKTSDLNKEFIKNQVETVLLS